MPDYDKFPNAGLTKDPGQGGAIQRTCIGEDAHDFLTLYVGPLLPVTPFPKPLVATGFPSQIINIEKCSALVLYVELISLGALTSFDVGIRFWSNPFTAIFFDMTMFGTPTIAAGVATYPVNKLRYRFAT